MSVRDDTDAKMRARGYLSAAEASRRIGRQRACIPKWLRAGRVRGVRVGVRWYVLVSSLVAHLGPESATMLGVS